MYLQFLQHVIYSVNKNTEGVLCLEFLRKKFVGGGGGGENDR